MSEAQAAGSSILETFGLSIEKRIRDELGATLTDDYPDVKEIRNQAGETTGYTDVYEGERLVKACAMSINVMPGARYFNIHIHPEARYLVPRFSCEGMLTAQGGQVSMDLYPDMDLVMEIDAFLSLTAGLEPVYAEAKESGMNVQASRFAHMRALSSPYFMNFVGPTIDQLPQIEAFANRYFDVWLEILNSAPELDAEAAAERQRRREHFAHMVIKLDPDRDMIVQVYGEEMTSAIENAVML